MRYSRVRNSVNDIGEWSAFTAGAICMFAGILLCMLSHLGLMIH